MTSRQSVWARLWAFARPYRFKLVLTFLLALSAAPLSLLVPLPLKIAVDSVVGNRPLPNVLTALSRHLGISSVTYELILIAGLLIAVTLLIYIQGLLSWIAQTWLGEKLALDLRAALFRHAQRLSLSYHDQTGTTDSVYRIQYDAQSLQFVIVNGFLPLASSAVLLCGMVVATALMDRELAIVALLVCPVLYVITRSFNGKLRQCWFEVKDLDSTAMSVVQEVLSAVRVVKAFGREEHEQERFVSRSSQRLGGQMALARIQGSFDLAVGVTIATGTATALVIGVLHVKAGAITIGQLFMVMAYLAQIYEPLRRSAKR